MELSPWMLVAVEGEYAGKRFPVPTRGLTFGREADNDLVLDDERISRRHATLWVEGGQIVIDDLKSRNGTFVNNKKVSKQLLRDGDRIALGSSLFQLAPRDADVVAPSGSVVAERTVVQQSRPVNRMQRTQAIVLEGHPGGGIVPLHGKASSEPAPELISPRSSLPSGLSERGPDQGGDPGFFSEKTGVLPERGNAEQPSQPRAPARVTLGDVPPGDSPFNEKTEILLEGSGGADGINLAAGPIFGGAAAGELLLNGPRASEQMPLGAPAPLEPLYAPRHEGSSARKLVFVAIAGVVVLGLGLTIALNAPLSSSQTPGAGAATQEALPMATGGSRALDAFRAPMPDARALLSAEEQAMDAAQREAKAAEHLEQGESFVASDRLKEARLEFERAVALNPDCEICLLRLSKVQADILRNLERYRNEAIRSYKAMEYTSARRYWELVLEFETDPEGRRVAIEGLTEARQRLQP